MSIDRQCAYILLHVCVKYSATTVEVRNEVFNDHRTMVLTRHQQHKRVREIEVGSASKKKTCIQSPTPVGSEPPAYEEERQYLNTILEDLKRIISSITDRNNKIVKQMNQYQ